MLIPTRMTFCLFHSFSTQRCRSLPILSHTTAASAHNVQTLGPRHSQASQAKGCNCGPAVHLSAAMAIKLEHSNLAQHQSSIFKRLSTFRKEGQLCDIVLKSRDGTEHRAHTAVLCAGSVELKNMLLGPFEEANRVQQGQPVELAASDTVVFALLEYIYGDEPQVELEESFELLHLADAYNFPELAVAIEAGLRASLDSAPVTTALKVLQQTQHLHQLKLACEKKVAANFENCIDLVDFLELSAGQLGRILRRDDLKVSREEVVAKGLFNWFHRSKDRGVHLGLLLQHLDFRALSSDNLARLRHLAASMGSVGHDLQREVDEAEQVHRENSADAFWPKRRCLQHWYPDLGASAQAPQIVLPPTYSLCHHDGTVYFSIDGFVLRWKPGDIQNQLVAGRGARVNGPSDLRPRCALSVSREGEIFVVDCDNRRLLSFENGSGTVVLSNVAVWCVSCSPNGTVYVLTQEGKAVERLAGVTLLPVISSEHLPTELQFDAEDLFVTKDEFIYILDKGNGRVLQLNPGEAEHAEPVVVGEVPNKESSWLCGLFVTEEKKIYVADYGQRKVWAFHPGDAAWTEVLMCPDWLKPVEVLVHGRSLYVSMYGPTGHTGGVYEYVLPPELQLG